MREGRRSFDKLRLHDYGRFRQVPSARGPHSEILVQPGGGPSEAAGGGAASRHAAAARSRRSRAAVPDVAHPAGGEHRARGGDSHARARRVPAMARDAALSRSTAREGARHAGAHLLQVRGREPGRQPQAQHRRGPGVLQQRSRCETHHDGDRRRTVGIVAGVRGRAVRARDRSLHGAGFLQSETVPAGVNGGLWRALRGLAVDRDQQWARRARLTPGPPGLARHCNFRSGGNGRATRRYQVRARLGAEPRAAASDGDRRRSHRADGDGETIRT